MGARGSKNDRGGGGEKSDVMDIAWPTYDEEEDSGGDGEVASTSLSEQRLGMVQRREAAAAAATHRSAVRNLKEIPITIVSGSLGAGKTTLMERIVGGIQGLKLGLVVNDYATLNVDYIKVQDTVEATAASADLVELSNGCVCCSLSTGLEESLWALLNDATGNGRVDYIVVETSGVTEASSILPALDAMPLRLESFVVVVNADSDMSKLSSARDLAVADVIILNKVDLVDSTDLVDEMERAIAAAAGEGASIHCAVASNVPITKVLAVDEVKPEREAFGRLQRGQERSANVRHELHPMKFSDGEDRNRGYVSGHDHKRTIYEGDRHISRLSSTVWRSGSSRVDPSRIQTAFSLHSDGVRRVKGMIRLDKGCVHGSGAYEVQMSGRRRMDVCETSVALPTSYLVIIGEHAAVDGMIGALDECITSVEDLIRMCDAPSVEVPWMWMIADSRFEFVEKKKSLVWFKLTGELEYAFTREELRRQFGIYDESVQRAFAKRANASLHPLLVYVDASHSSGVVCGIADTAFSCTKDARKVLEEAAEEVFRVLFKSVSHCRCGK